MTYTHEKVLADVGLEYERAAEKFPAFNSAHEGFAVLDEERDELWEVVKKNPAKRYPNARDPHVAKREEMREEAIQIAAMAVRFIVDVCDR